MQDHVVLGPHVLAATEEVSGLGPAVLVEGGVQRPAPAADVEHERDPGLLQRGPHGVEIGMGRRVGFRRRRRNEDGAAPHLDRLARRRHGPFGDVEGHEADADEAGIVAAGLGDRSVVGAGAAVEKIRIVADELRRRERREHQLPLEPEQVEGPAALGRIEGAEGAPSLRRQQVLFGRLGRRRVAPAGVGPGHRLVGQPAGAAQVHRPQPVTDARIGVAHQPVARLHQVAVGVVEDAPFGVRHGYFGSISSASELMQYR